MFAAAAVATAVEPTAAAQQNNYRTRKLHSRVFDEPDDDDAAVDIVAVGIAADTADFLDGAVGTVDGEPLVDSGDAAAGAESTAVAALEAGPIACD